MIDLNDLRQKMSWTIVELDVGVWVMDVCQVFIVHTEHIMY